MALSWDQPICERCWLLRDDNWTEDSVRIPVRISDDSGYLHQCAFCGYPTFVGIYVRQDPSTVQFPREKEEVQ